jgi:hypothetical protein
MSPSSIIAFDSLSRIPVPNLISPQSTADGQPHQSDATGAYRYQSEKSILKNSLDAVPPEEPPPTSPPSVYEMTISPDSEHLLFSEETILYADVMLLIREPKFENRSTKKISKRSRPK